MSGKGCRKAKSAGAFQSVVDVNDRVGQKEGIMVAGAGVSPLRRPAVASSCLEGVRSEGQELFWAY